MANEQASLWLGLIIGYGFIIFLTLVAIRFSVGGIKFFSLIGQYDSDKNLSIVGIHATVLSILIGLSTAYVLHVNSQITEVESEALSIAERVNTIKFSRVWLRLVWPATKFLEEWTSTDQQVPMWLTTFSNYTAFPDKWEKDKANIPYIKALTEKYKLNPTEFYLCLMGASALRYPFPDRLVQDKARNVSGGFQPSPVSSFSNIDSVKKWSDDVWNYYLSSMDFNTWFGQDEFTKRFDWANGVNLNKFYGSPDEKHSAEFIELLKKTPNEYLTNIEKLFNIRASVVPKLKRYDDIKKLMPSKYVTYTVFIWAIIAFGSAVIAPLIYPSINKIFIVWVPCTFYLFIMLYSSIMVFDKFY